MVARYVKVVFLIIFFPISVYSSDECSLSKLQKWQKLSLAEKVGFYVDAWAQGEMHTFKGSERRRVIQACCWGLKKVENKRIDALGDIDFKEILNHVEKIKKEKSEA